MNYDELEKKIEPFFQETDKEVSKHDANLFLVTISDLYEKNKSELERLKEQQRNIEVANSNLFFLAKKILKKTEKNIPLYVCSGEFVAIIESDGIRISRNVL